MPQHHLRGDVATGVLQKGGCSPRCVASFKITLSSKGSKNPLFALSSTKAFQKPLLLAFAWTWLILLRMISICPYLHPQVCKQYGVYAIDLCDHGEYRTDHLDVEHAMSGRLSLASSVTCAWIKCFRIIKILERFPADGGVHNASCGNGSWLRGLFFSSILLAGECVLGN